MRKTLHGAVVAFVFFGLLMQFATRWSPALFSRLSPPGGYADAIDSEDPVVETIVETD